MIDMTDCFIMEQQPCEGFEVEDSVEEFDPNVEYIPGPPGPRGDPGPQGIPGEYSSSNPPPYPVRSVNEKTGDVSLDKEDIGLENVANELQYSESNPPPYPVTSVNGQTGEVDIEPGSSPVLLWTNPNPTSTFAEQTIPLDLSEYSFVIIEYGHDYGFVTGAAIFPVPTITPTQGYSAYNEIQGVKWTGSQCALYLRRLKITTSSIWFDDGTRFTAYNTSGSTTTDNNVGFPKRIWGVK